MGADLSPMLRLERGTRGPRIVAGTHHTSVVLAEFPGSGDPRTDSLRHVLARLCLGALEEGLPQEERGAPGPALPELLGLALAACDEADTAFAVLNVTDGLTPQARRAVGEAWVLVQEAVGASRGQDSVHAAAARENRAVLRALVAAEAVDRYAAAMAAGADANDARDAAVAAAAEPPGGTAAGAESVWDLARECVDAWPAIDGDEPVSGAELVEWFAAMRARLRAALHASAR